MSIRNNIGTRKFYRTALLIAVPIMIQNGITNFVGLLDNIMVGRNGTVEMTGVSIANTLIFVFNLAVFGAVSGAGIFGAQFHGKGDAAGVRYAFRYKLIETSLLLVIGSGVLFFFGEPLLRLFLKGEGNASDIEGSLRFGYRYVKIMLIGLPAFALVQCYAGSLRETGHTVLPMTAGVIAVCVNCFLNWVLIFGKFGAPRLGSDGAAIATVISRYVEVLIVIVCTHKRPDQHPFIRGAYSSLRIPGKLVRDITKKGMPLIFNETLWALGQSLLLQSYSIRGYGVVAATNIAVTLGNVFNVAFMAMGASIGILVGQLLGAGKVEEAKDTDRKLIAFSEIICVVFGGIMACIAGVFPHIYKTEIAIRTLATKFILINAALMPVNSYSNAAYFTLRSGGKTYITFLFDSFFSCVVVAPVAYCLSRFTSMPIVLLYACCQGVEIVKCMIGYGMIRSGIWIQNIVKDE